MKDIILAASKGYDWNQISPWVRSLRNTGYGDDIAIVLYDEPKAELLAKLKSYDVEALFSPTSEPIFNGRFFDFGRVLLGRTHRFAVITDIRDVWFQSDPIKWLSSNLQKPLLACSESIRYRDEPWNRHNMKAGFPQYAEWLLDQCIYNVGVLAGQMAHVRDLCLAINLWTRSSGQAIADQSAFNIMLRLEPYKSSTQLVASEEGFAAQLGTTADPQKINQFRPFLLGPEPKLGEKGVTTSTGTQFCMVHQYDRVPDWRNYLLSKLGSMP